MTTKNFINMEAYVKAQKRDKGIVDKPVTPKPDGCSMVFINPEDKIADSLHDVEFVSESLISKPRK